MYRCEQPIKPVVKIYTNEIPEDKGFVILNKEMVNRKVMETINRQTV